MLSNKEVGLTNEEPVWTAENGYIFEIDGIFNQLNTNDTTLLMYRNAIETDPELSNFRILIDRAEMKADLDTRGPLAYTVFAPINDAFDGMNVSTLDKEDAQKLLKKHMVQGRKIFTDGTSTGIQNTISNNTLTISGAWEEFSIRLQYSSARIAERDVKKNANIQCSNGVLHKIDGVINN